VTVEELIAKLSQMPQGLSVLLDGYEDGLDDVIDATIVNVDFETDKEWWYGHHECNEQSKSQAVYLKSNKKTGV